MQYKTFETQRLLLRPTTQADAGFILKLMNSPKWIQFIGDRNVHTPEQAKQYIQNKMQPQLVRLGYSNYTVNRKSDGENIGCCGLYDREGLAGIDIGFAFLPGFEGQGYAFEAASRLMLAGQEDFGLKEIYGITAKNNTASQKLLDKLGFYRKGELRLPDEDAEVYLYAWNAQMKT